MKLHLSFCVASLIIAAMSCQTRGYNRDSQTSSEPEMSEAAERNLFRLFLKNELAELNDCNIKKRKSLALNFSTPAQVFSVVARDLLDGKSAPTPSPAELLAIHYYTMDVEVVDDETEESKLTTGYEALSRTVANNRKCVQVHADTLKALRSGLTRVSLSRLQTYSGTSLSEQTLTNDYAINGTHTFDKLVSTSRSRNVAEGFAQSTEIQKAAIYVIDGMSGRDLENYSAFQIEKEVLYFPGVKFKVTNVQRPTDVSKPLEISLTEIGGGLPLSAPTQFKYKLVPQTVELNGKVESGLLFNEIERASQTDLPAGFTLKKSPTDVEIRGPNEFVSCKKTSSPQQVTCAAQVLSVNIYGNYFLPGGTVADFNDGKVSSLAVFFRSLCNEDNVVHPFEKFLMSCTYSGQLDEQEGQIYPYFLAREFLN